MPQTINGIGTRYVGSKSTHTREDTCEHCGNLTTVRSYDTTKFVVVIFVPLVPLGRFRILDECSICTKHYAVPLSTWQAQRDEELGSASRALESDPWSPERARTLIQACVSYQDEEALERMEAKIAQALSSDAPGWAFLGSAHEYFSDPSSAESAYRKSLALQDETGVHESLGLLLLRADNPAEAKEHLWHLTRPAADNDPLLYFLVETYQARGMHDEAEAVLETMVSSKPGLARDELFQKYRARVRKHLGGDRRVASPLVRGKGLGHDPSRQLWIVAAVVAVAVALGGLFLYQKTRRIDLYVVNGLETPYSLRVADDVYEIPPKSYIEIDVPRIGDLEARAETPELAWTSRVPVPVPTTFWAALFDDATYVLNPDHTAPIVWEQAEYREHPIEKEVPTRLYLGRGFYVFTNLDYVFEEFPQQITLDANRVVETRDRIWWPTEIGPAEVLSAAFELDATDGVDGYLIGRLRAYPGDSIARGFAASLLSREQFLDLAQPHLAERPLRVEWHRTYQSMLELEGRVEDLASEYEALLAVEPDNADLKYLYARVTRDPAASERWLLEATSAASPSAYAFHALAFLRLTETSFEEALALSRRAQELAPEVPDFSYAEGEALLALGRYDTLIERNQRLREENPGVGEYVASGVRLQMAKGDTAAARKLIDDYMYALYQTQPEGETASWKNYLESVYHLGAGQWKSYIERASAIGEPRFDFQSALASGNHRAAISAVAASEASPSDYLLAYLSARRGKDASAATEYLATAVENLSELSADERALARCLEGSAPASDVYVLTVVPELKAVAAAVMAERSGNARLRRLARGLSYQLSFERYYLEAAFF